LQRRLTELGFATPPHERARYGPHTTDAVAAFQRARGLSDDGRCDATTWAAMVEAGYELGDRVLLRRTPMLRGDDIAELQRRLSALGFDTGRVDGIFGADTHHGVQEFQRNAGLVADGICGPGTLAALQRLGSRVYATPVTEVRERFETIRPVSELAVGIGTDGSMTAAARRSVKALRLAGAQVVALDDPDLSVHARIANEQRLDAYLGFGAGNLTEAGVTVTSYGTSGYESPRGRVLARMLAGGIAAVGVDARCSTRSIPILRETRMPAVWCELGLRDAMERVVPQLAPIVHQAFAQWSSAQGPDADVASPEG
jgi:N-acetylmuramoyl-L-alanine amidase